ncbi:MAG: cytochrome c [Robiginitomaculum sp.]|nr:cytochrome c [Robiginitomaculum sp.]
MKKLVCALATVTVISLSSTSQVLASPGEEIYMENCAACHGEDGKGALPGITPDLTSLSGPLSKSDEELITSITEGFESPGSQMAMPPLGGNDELDEDDVKEILEYMREEFGDDD